jgi:hypothetical protein
MQKSKRKQKRKRKKMAPPKTLETQSREQPPPLATVELQTSSPTMLLA